MQYQQQNPELLLCIVYRTSAHRLLKPINNFILYKGTEHNKVDQYLREVLSRLIRNLLSVPATGIGVERLFNKALKEDKALKVNKEDTTPISDDKEIKETEDIESNIESEALYQAEGILVGTQQPLIYNQTYNVEGDEE
ncbi:unnamed protein product [Penicillium camemberti]|uniref:Str. FM013 n=1 Tax=Penicillium camemberti (strain FM 013) TaxID=1429867 RepID=A0A0G4PV51_PENC3|nr:unnamed protein product [Penicillium camemberti]